MLIQPRSHIGMVVCAVVVEYQMQRFTTRELSVESAQELQKFLVAMALVAFADHRTVEHAERSEQ